MGSPRKLEGVTEGNAKIFLETSSSKRSMNYFDYNIINFDVNIFNTGIDYNF